MTESPATGGRATWAPVSGAMLGDLHGALAERIAERASEPSIASRFERPYRFCRFCESLSDATVTDLNGEYVPLCRSHLDRWAEMGPAGAMVAAPGHSAKECHQRIDVGVASPEWVHGDCGLTDHRIAERRGTGRAADAACDVCTHGIGQHDGHGDGPYVCDVGGCACRAGRFTDHPAGALDRDAAGPAPHSAGGDR